MREADVRDGYVDHLRERGWDVTTENSDHVDVIAQRGAEVIVAEVKGHSSSPGVDVDTLYGQILRRMRPDRGDCTYILVVPERLVWHVRRVDRTVRDRLGLSVVVVDDLGGVRDLESGWT